MWFRTREMNEEILNDGRMKRLTFRLEFEGVDLSNLTALGDVSPQRPTSSPLPFAPLTICTYILRHYLLKDAFVVNHLRFAGEPPASNPTARSSASYAQVSTSSARSRSGNIPSRAPASGMAPEHDRRALGRPRRIWILRATLSHVLQCQRQLYTYERSG